MEDFESAFTNKNNYTLNSFSQLSTVLKTGEALSVRNPALGEVEIRFGGRNDGLAHIILRRIEERTHRTQDKETLDVASKKVTMILGLVKEAAEKIEAVKAPNGKYNAELNGIKVIIGKDAEGRYVVTGFDNKQKKRRQKP